MELTLSAVIINGEEFPVTKDNEKSIKEEVREHLKNRKIELPEPLAKKMIENRQKQALKNPVPSNRVFSSNITK